MYFLIHKKDNRFEKQTFQNSTPWEEIVSKIDGTLIELFQSDKLEMRHFDEYFNATYRKKK